MASASYQSIKSMSADFKAMLSNLEYPYPFTVEETELVVLVDLQNDLGDILAENPAKLALIMGIDENRPTICILGADSNGNILSAHTSGSLDGQQRWPDTQTIRYEDDTDYGNFFV
ncbi:MAG TPA: hypothetical protein VD993_16075 [Chitinophagaceae bacterium]|nr:hypothetical protein [Chitinophagaceae bacterium]